MSPYPQLTWVPLLVLTAYVPLAWYHDLRYRTMPIGFWSALLVICIPITIYQYVTGVYPLEALAVSVPFIGLYLSLLIYDVFKGADFWYLAWIALFFVTNPISGHSLMAIPFFIFLIVSIVMYAILYQMGLLKGLMKRGRFPMMLQIGTAFLLTVFLA